MSTPLLNNKVAIITGASSGIGKSIAIKYADEGAKVVISSRNLLNCKKVSQDILNKGQEAAAVSCDVRKEEEVIALFDQAESDFGSVDIVVANAGIGGNNKIVADCSLLEWHKVLLVNLTGVFLTVREAFRRMKDKGGHIIFISSVNGFEGEAGLGAYCASKFGVRGLAQSLAEEGRQFNIRVSTICPSTVDTPFLSKYNCYDKYPMSPDVIADAALFFASQNKNVLTRELTLERMNRNES